MSNDDYDYNFGRFRYGGDSYSCMTTAEQTNPYHNYIDITVAPSRSTTASPIYTNGPEETDQYIESLRPKVYGNIVADKKNVPNTESAVTVERQVSLRCLEPPPVEPGKHIITEKFGPPKPSPPIHIIEAPPQPRPQSPLVFREEPPARPKTPPPTKETREVPNPEHAPPSIIIERYEPPTKPRDIIIERWLPYAPPPRRITEVIPPGPPPEPPKPTITINMHPAPPVRVVSKFKCLGVTAEDPAAYKSRHGSTLLAPATLVERVRREGVTDDITCPCSVTPKSSCECGCSGGYPRMRSADPHC